MRAWTVLFVTMGAMSLGCAVGDADGSTSFGSFTGPPTRPTTPDTGSNENTDTGDETGNGTRGGTVGPGDSTTGPAESTAALEGTTTAAETTTGGTFGDSSDSSDDGPPPPGGGVQPATGMWAHCFTGMLDACDGLGCLSSSPGGVDNGYCTDLCTIPAIDCPPPAGATTPSICVEAMDMDGMLLGICALDCSAASCPTGMSCELIDFNGVATDVCL